MQLFGFSLRIVSEHIVFRQSANSAWTFEAELDVIDAFPDTVHQRHPLVF
jgi:hypothetical protein